MKQEIKVPQKCHAEAHKLLFHLPQTRNPQCVSSLFGFTPHQLHYQKAIHKRVAPLMMERNVAMLFIILDLESRSKQLESGSRSLEVAHLTSFILLAH